MKEKVQGFFGKLKTLLGKVSKKVLIAAAVVLLAVIVAVVVLVSRQPDYAVLFTGLTSTEMSEILARLDEDGVTDYKVENNDTILVPADQEAQLKVPLLMEGYPSSGFSHSTYYDNISALSTQSERNTVEKYDLEDRMSAVVRNFENVKEAVVTINLGEDTTFLLDDSGTIEASASVLVIMQGNTMLTTDQAMAIRHYLAHGIKGLEVDEVTVTDNLGNTYSTADSTADSDASALKLQLEQEYENKTRTKVMHALLPFFGEGNVNVEVSLTVDVSQVVEDATEVYLPDYALDGSTDGEGIKGAQIFDHTVTRDVEQEVGGVVGSETNSDMVDDELSEYVEDLMEPQGNEQDVHVSGTIEYDNPRKETQTIRTAGYITDCSIAVTINANTAGAVDLQSIRVHTARAAGIDGVLDENTGEEFLEDRISVLAMPFYTEEEAEPLPPDDDTLFDIPMIWLYVAAGGLLLLIILLVLILIIARKRRKKRRQMALHDQNVDAILDSMSMVPETKEPAGADVMEMQTEKSMELRKDIRQFADDNPEIAAQMLKGWLRGGADNG